MRIILQPTLRHLSRLFVPFSNGKASTSRSTTLQVRVKLRRVGWIVAVVATVAGICLPFIGRSVIYAAAPQPPTVPHTGSLTPPSRKVLPVLSQKAAVPAADAFETVVKPMIRENCVGCHNEVKLKGDLDLERFLNQPANTALRNRAVWDLVLQKLKAGEMPPPGKPAPSPEQVAAATQWIEQQYALLDSQAPADPGRVTARRLNRYEYNNTVRDLLAVNLPVANDFPPDPYGYGFDNIGDVLTLSPVLTEMYFKAAERVAKVAIPLVPPEQGVTVRYEPMVMGQVNKLHVQVTHDFPADALYSLRFGWEHTLIKGAVIFGHISLDGKEITKQSMIIDRKRENGFESPEVRVSQGEHLFEASVDLPPDYKGGIPYITEMEIFGPSKPVPYRQTVSYKRIFFKGPPSAGAQTAYTRAILARLARRAYRRPVRNADLVPLMSLAKLVRSHGGSCEESIQVALQGILMSPNFLFRIERDPAGDSAHRVSDTELASRLSYFLWSSLPDDRLLALAESGQLHEPEILHAQVQRMLTDPRAHSLATNFGGEWLQTRNLQFQTPDKKAFPEYDVVLREDMRTETDMFFESIISEDRSILDFVDGKFTFLNDRLAKLYDIPGVEGSAFRRVSLDGTQRSGILTQASVLTASSYPTRTSPVIRGKWVLENILNTPPPPPPPNVPTLDDHDVGTAASVRQRLEVHRANPVCAACHSRMDPLGFALENYDGIGRWRTAEGQFPIDASARLPDGRTFTGAAELKTLLKADSPMFVRSLTVKMMIYALGRGIEPSDKPAVEQVARRIETNQYRFSQLIYGIVDSVPFQMRERESAPSEPLQTASIHSNVHSSQPSNPE